MGIKGEEIDGEEINWSTNILELKFVCMNLQDEAKPLEQTCMEHS